MELIESDFGRCWCDPVNNNKWRKENYTYEAACAAADTLDHCANCIDCEQCYFCCACDSCKHCAHSYMLTRCKSCTCCMGSTDVQRAWGCLECAHSSYLNYCSHVYNSADVKFVFDGKQLQCCAFGSSLTSCTNTLFSKGVAKCKATPEHFVSTNIGSRDDVLLYYPKLDRAVTGCFRGDLVEFEQAVKKRHEVGSKFRRQYLKLIKKLKGMFVGGK